MGGGPHPNTADYLLATGAPDDVALVEGGQRHTYRQLRAAAAAVAAELAALGLAPGARVGILAPNSLFWVASYLAIMKLDLVAVPFPDKLTPEGVRRGLDLTGCDAVLVDRRLRRRHPDLATPGRDGGGADADGGAGLAVLTDEILGTGSARRWPGPRPADPDADAVLSFTSGTTAAPRAVRVTHRNLQANTASILAFLHLRRDDRVLVVLPFHYCYGASLLHTHLRAGARLVLCNSFVFPEVVLDQLQREECTVFAGVPSSFHLLLRAGRLADRDLGCLRLVQQAGGKLSPVVLGELVAALPSAEIFVMYGQTEATARLSYLPPAMLAGKPGSIGHGIPGVELTVRGEDGREVPPGVVGEIYARGANISPGYAGDPAGTAEKFTPYGLRTGDLAVVDADGDIYVVDRRDDFIKSWGYRVSSQEVEACVLEMPDVVQAAVVGVPDAEAGEAVTLFVTLRPGAALAPADLQAFCARHLPRHMVPRSVVVTDRLPLTDSGKVAKARLRELATVTPSAAR